MTSVPHAQDSPFQFDIQEMGRRAGAMMIVERQIPAPTDWGNAVMGFKADSTIDVDAQFESVIEGVWVSGTAEVELEGSCSRCLDPVVEQVAFDLQEMFQYPEIDEAAANEDDLPLVVDEQVDLEATIRDAVVLGMPLAPVCDTNCLGLCSICGVRLSEDPDHAHEQVDPRWEILNQLKKEDH